MLMESKVDPFKAQETQPYKTDPQIQAMTSLVEAYQESNIQKFERTLSSNRTSILEDPFIRPYIQDLITSLRTQVCAAALLRFCSLDFLQRSRLGPGASQSYGILIATFVHTDTPALA